jgi:opacity protein-like surface antigen
MRKICLAVLLVPALAWAQPKQAPKTAVEWYKEGENQYILGNFEKAVEAFKNGFTLETDEDKRAKYVFNIAQSYRQANDCAKAHFFYKRFLALKASPKAAPLDPQSRQQVEDRIKDLEACAQQAALISKRPPDSLPGDEPDNKPPGGEVRKAAHDEVRPEVAAPGNAAAGTDEEERTDTGEPRPMGARPHLISARLTGGGTKVRMGPMVKVPVQAAFALTGGYPIAIDDRLTVDAGAVLTLTPVPYSVRQPMSTDETSKTALLTGVMANGGVSYEAAPRLSVRADIGLGALLFSNVSRSRFTNGNEASGALTMFHLRAAPAADYAFTPNILGTVTVAFTYSPAKDGLDDTINSITSFDFMLGIGYRM